MKYAIQNDKGQISDVRFATKGEAWEHLLAHASMHWTIVTVPADPVPEPVGSDRWNLENSAPSEAPISDGGPDLDAYEGKEEDPCGPAGAMVIAQIGQDIMQRAVSHYIIVRERLRDIIDVRQCDGGRVAMCSISDPHGDDGLPVDGAATSMLSSIRAAVAPEYDAEWTGDSTGDESDVTITVREDE